MTKELYFTDTFISIKYDTAQMQLQSQAGVSSIALGGLLKVTCDKFYKSLRSSTLSSLVSITNLGVCL